MARVLAVTAAAVLAVVALAVPALVVALLFPGLWLPGLVEDRLEARLGRRVEVGGPVALDLFEDGPAIEVRDLRIANPPWAAEPTFLRAAEVRMEFDRAALWRFEIEPTVLALDSPRVVLVRARSGGVTWPRPEGGGVGGLGLNRLRVSGGEAVYRNEETATTLTAAIETRDGQLAVDAKGTWDGTPITVSLVGGAPLEIMGDDAYPLRADLRSGDLHLTVNGTVSGLPAVRGLDMHLAGQGPSLARVGALVGVPFPNSPPFDLSGRLRTQGQVWEYTDASGVIGESDVAGRVTVRPGPTPDIEVEVASQHLRVKDAMVLAGGGGLDTGDRQGSDRLIPDVPLLASALEGLSLQVRLTAEDAVGGPVPLGALLAHLSVSDGRMTVDPLEFTLPHGGEAAGRVLLIAANGTPELAVRGTVERAAFRVSMGQGEHAEGVVGGRFDLSGRGDSLVDVLGSAQGEAAVLVSDALLTRDVVDHIGIAFSDVFGLLLPDGGARQGTQIRCAAATFDVRDGIAHIPALVVDADTGRAQGKGNLDLAAERLDLMLNIDPAKPQVLSFSGPVQVSGPLTNPSVEPQMGGAILRGAVGVGLGLLAGPLAALVPFMDSGLGSESGCHGATPETSEVP